MSGAMENWVRIYWTTNIEELNSDLQGLITGHADFYLLDPAREDLASKKWIASNQTHEIAHQVSGHDSNGPTSSD